jgi:DNA repair protein RadC
MTGPIWGVRELDIRYKPLRLPMPVRSEINGPQEAARLAAAVLADVTVEKVIALHLTTKHTLIGVHVVSVGTLNASLVHPRDVFKAAFLANAAGLVLAHNHPSGDLTPSPEDQAVVSRLLQAGELLGVELLDAVIVTDPSEGGAYYSFKEAGALR